MRVSPQAEFNTILKQKIKSSYLLVLYCTVLYCTVLYVDAGDGTVRATQSSLQAPRQPIIRRPLPGEREEAQRRLRHLPLAGGVQGHSGGGVHSGAPEERG